MAESAVMIFLVIGSLNFALCTMYGAVLLAAKVFPSVQEWIDSLPDYEED